MKPLGLFVLGLLVGVLMTRLVSTPVAVQPLSTEQEWAEAGVAKIREAGDSAAQMRAAEDYYGKAVVLFLASLAGQLAQPEQMVGTLPEPIIKEISESEVPQAADAPSVGSVPSSQQRLKVNPSPVDPNEAELSLQQLINYRKAPLANKMSPQVKKLSGSFEGRFTHVPGGPDKRVDRVTMDMNFHTQDGKLMGDVQITMTDPSGHMYSRSNNDGNNRTLRLVPGRKDQIYIEPSPGSFILLDIGSEHRMRGRYFNPQGEFKGIVEIWRKN